MVGVDAHSDTHDVAVLLARAMLAADAAPSDVDLHHAAGHDPRSRRCARSTCLSGGWSAVSRGASAGPPERLSS